MSGIIPAIKFDGLLTSLQNGN